MSRLGILLLGVMALNTVAGAEFVGTQQCPECHLEEYRAWEKSHHDFVMQEVSEATILGDLNNAQYLYNGITTTFSRDNGEYRVATDVLIGLVNYLTELRDRSAAVVYAERLAVLVLDNPQYAQMLHRLKRLVDNQ